MLHLHIVSRNSYRHGIDGQPRTLPSEDKSSHRIILSPNGEEMANNGDIER